MKNIPIPPRSSYLKSFTEKVESFLKRLRWKAYFFEHPSPSNDTENFGFTSDRTPPHSDSLAPFESDMYDMIKNIKFKDRCSNQFQTKLKSDLKNIQSSKNMFIFADKTSNIYEMPSADYTKLLNENITKSYRKADPSSKDQIDHGQL